MRYQFLIDTYETERLKVLGVWSMFRDDDLSARPHSTDPRGRSVREQMVHQCVSENLWFRNMLEIDLGTTGLPPEEIRLRFIQQYAQDSDRRLAALREKPEAWWEQEVLFFDVRRSRAWIMVRRIAHTSHHRGQQTAMLRFLGRDLHSTYGPSADTGGLMQNNASVTYAYPDVDALLEGELSGGKKRLSLGRETNRQPSVPDPLNSDRPSIEFGGGMNLTESSPKGITVNSRRF